MQIDELHDKLERMKLVEKELNSVYKKDDMHIKLERLENQVDQLELDKEEDLFKLKQANNKNKEMEDKVSDLTQEVCVLQSKLSNVSFDIMDEIRRKV